jgi:hypothetical protein
MEYMRKVFLFSVGVIALAYDEIEKRVKETQKVVHEQREKISQRLEKQEA